jgi:hypothetical protein
MFAGKEKQWLQMYMFIHWKNVCYVSCWSCDHCVPVRLLIHIFLGVQLVKTGQSCSLHILNINSSTDYFLCDLGGAPETSDVFWNLKTSVPATWCFHTDHHHVQWCLEFSWWSAGQCNNALKQWNCLSKQSVMATQRSFRQHFHRHDAPCCNTLLLWVS